MIENTKRVTRTRKSKDRQYNDKKRTRTNNDVKHYTSSNTNLTKNWGMNSGAPEGQAVPAPLVALIVLLLLHIR